MWPENWEALQLFASLGTQWRVGMGGATGMDYTAILAVIRSMRLPRARADELFADVRIMERAALEKMREGDG